MAFRGLSAFTYFSLDDFLVGKQLVFVKAGQWSEGEGKDTTIEGTKVIVQIVKDETKYFNEDITNFGEQITVKVRGVTPNNYQKLKPLQSEVEIADVEKATVWGDYKNQLSVIAVVNVKGGTASKE